MEKAKRMESFVGVRDNKKHYVEVLWNWALKMHKYRQLNLLYAVVTRLSKWKHCRELQVFVGDIKPLNLVNYTESESCFCEVDDKQCAKWIKMLFVEFDNKYLIP